MITGPSRIVNLFVILIMTFALFGTMSVTEAKVRFELNESFENEEIKLGVEVKKDDFVMPTSEDMINDSIGYKNRISGTDKWNDLILKVSEEEQVDPIFVKCIMALESAGEVDLVHNNTNGTQDFGLMQINSTWKDSFEISRLTEDPEYAIRAGIQVIKLKIAAAERNGKTPTVHEVAWRYNGYSEMGRKYANKFVQLYDDLSNEDSYNKSILLNNENNDETLI